MRRSPLQPHPRSTRGIATMPLLALLACAAVYVLATSRLLPEMVASHFGAGARAGAFMPRTPYTVFMLAIVVGVPLFIGLVPARAFRSPGVRINLANADYWLAPERRDATIAVLSHQMRRFATLLLAFLCYAHGLVVVANQATPPSLSMAWFAAGLGIFFVVTLAWVVSLNERFRKLPR